MSKRNYSGLTDLGQALLRPETYVGNVFPTVNSVFSLDYENKKLLKKDIEYTEGLHRIFLEILSNAGDNVLDSRKNQIDVGVIKVDIDDARCSIYNEGRHIPVERKYIIKKGKEYEVLDYDALPKKEQTKHTPIWLPSYIFGQLRTGSNYDDKEERMGSGRNGFGSKLTNLFSKKFTVIIEDPYNKKRYTGVWRDNMFQTSDNVDQKAEDTVVVDKNIKKGSCKVIWEADFARFGCISYTPDDIDMFAKYTADYSFSCKVPTYFDGIELDFRRITDYAKLIFSEEELKNSFYFFVWKNDVSITLAKQLELSALEKENENFPVLEILCIDSPNKGISLSYVNGLQTSEGGMHEDACIHPIKDYVFSLVDLKGKRINISHIRKHLSFIISARLVKPCYDSQTKKKLVSPKVKDVVYPSSLLKKINGWEVVDAINMEIKHLTDKMVKKTDGKNTRYKGGTEDGEEANFAATQSEKCVLYVAEGNSALGYLQRRICTLEHGKDYAGYMPLKGKLLNITTCEMEQYMENKVIQRLKSTIGLREEEDYDDIRNIKTLRYGYIIIATDADDDGKHILTHVLNFFRQKFPGLLRNGRVGYLRTPLIRVLKGNKEIKKFFKEEEFDEWKEKTDTKGLNIEYFKGLASHSNTMIENDIKDCPTVVCFYDSNADYNFDIAFGKGNADKRKEWIAKWRDIAQTEDVLDVDINSISKTFGEDTPLIQAQNSSQLINRELVEYSVASLFRTIPSMYDSLKKVQRQILYGVYNIFNFNPKSSVKSTSYMKLMTRACDDIGYHHGPSIFVDSSIRMSHDYVGANNMPFFAKQSQIGSRAKLGKDAGSARYISTRIVSWADLVYEKESINIIPKVMVEGDEAEPEWLPGVIPMGVVNGMCGIATGYSTYVPPRNPIDIIDWFISRCKGDVEKEPYPWFNGFKGKIEIVDVKDDIVQEEELDIIDLEEDSEEAIVDKALRTCKKRMVTYGDFKVISGTKKGYKIHITELPIGVGIIDYKNWIEKNIVEKKLFKSYRDKAKGDYVDLEVECLGDIAPTVKTLNLIKNKGISNITLIDKKGFPKQYNSLVEYLEDYFKIMIEHYKELIRHRIYNKEQQLKDVGFKYLYIKKVVDKEILLLNSKKKELYAQLDSFKIPHKIADDTRSIDFTEEEAERHKQKIRDIKLEIEELKKQTPENVWIEKLTRLKKELSKRFKDGVLIHDKTV